MPFSHFLYEACASTRTTLPTHQTPGYSRQCKDLLIIFIIPLKHSKNETSEFFKEAQYWDVKSVQRPEVKEPRSIPTESHRLKNNYALVTKRHNPHRSKKKIASKSKEYFTASCDKNIRRSELASKAILWTECNSRISLSPLRRVVDELVSISLLFRLSLAFFCAPPRISAILKVRADEADSMFAMDSRSLLLSATCSMSKSSLVNFE